MNRLLLVRVPWLAALLSACGPQGGLDVASADSRTGEVEEAHAFFERAWRERLALSPEQQSRLGIRDDYDQWDDRSETGLRRERELYVSQLEELNRSVDYDELDAEARLSYELFVDEANRRIEEYRWRHHDYPVNQMRGIQSFVPAFLIGIHTIETETDAQAYVSRLIGIGPLFDQVIEGLERRADRGIVPPRFVFDYVLTDCRNVLAGRPFDNSERDSVLLEDFASKLAAIELPEARRATLLTDASRALEDHVGPAYRRLIEAVEALERRATTDDGVWKLPDGAAYYEFQLRNTTTTGLSAEEIHRLGLRETARIHDEMREVMRRVEFAGTLPEFFEHMRRSPQFFFPEGEAGRQAYLAEATALIAAMRERLDAIFITKPRADIEVRAVEAFREKSAGKAFYQSSTPDGRRPGVYYINLHRMADLPRYEMQALAFHEGIPGHHMQRAIALELEDLPSFRRFFPATAYTEGWGLYAERLGKELGFYADPYSEYGRLSMELVRAARLVVDTGIHMKRWTREQAIAWHLENTPMPEGAAAKAVERYIVMPGQATAYMVGMLKLVELRERAENALGEDFDLREFHDLVLRTGPVSLRILERLVDDHIGQARQGRNNDEGRHQNQKDPEGAAQDAR